MRTCTHSRDLLAQAFELDRVETDRSELSISHIFQLRGLSHAQIRQSGLECSELVDGAEVFDRFPSRQRKVNPPKPKL